MSKDVKPGKAEDQVKERARVKRLKEGFNEYDGLIHTTAGTREFPEGGLVSGVNR